jgi:NAD(P)-dependent dehydrogenase (short-subunit alcohol dehydrogenase family)
MGIEGFLEEVAPFGIGCTLVEPGSARTDFSHRNALLASALEAYDISPSRMLNRIVADRSQLAPGDPIKMAKIMIASVEEEPALMRIAGQCPPMHNEPDSRF